MIVGDAVKLSAELYQNIRIASDNSPFQGGCRRRDANKQPPILYKIIFKIRNPNSR
jgi:hypothetical protein